MVRCMAYIDLNMVRACVVEHPREWKHCGYNEIVDPPQRYRLLARDRLKQLLGAGEYFLTDNYQHWIDEYIQKSPTREKSWTEAVAVGSSSFVEKIKEQLGIKAKYRHIHKNSRDAFTLKETSAAYNYNFECQMPDLSFENRLYWKLF